jgi:predicted dehydrogenase
MNNLKASEPLGLGLLGCGAFGRFCLEQYQGLSEVKPVAVADVKAELAQATAAQFRLSAEPSPEALLRREDVQIVHIATPPTTHYALALQALAAGKHVLCEKPLATRLEEAEAMLAAARQARRILAVNLIMRYNPLCIAVQQILSEKLLGEPLHAFFENYAKDEPLGPGHWFWDPAQSGGIFIEHGVHFFDLFMMWLGPGEILTAQQITRPGSRPPFVEQVYCTARYGEKALVNFYHGFHQASRMDRQEMRIVCERGDIRLFEWVPTELQLDLLADEATKERLVSLLPEAPLVSTTPYTGEARHVTSRHKSYLVDGRYLITGGVGLSKQELYGKVIRDLLTDQVAAIHDPTHQRRVTEQNGVSSLQLAVRATELAQTI